MSASKHGERFDLHALAARFPDEADSLLLDQYLTRNSDVSTRLFRVYRPTPAHYHVGSDEHLYVLSGRGTFWMGEASNTANFGPGHLLCFPRTLVHAQPEILQGPVVFLAFDTPPRAPDDIHFVDPRDGSPSKFIQSLLK